MLQLQKGPPSSAPAPPETTLPALTISRSRPPVAAEGADNVLGVSWLNGEFKAVTLGKGGSGEAFEGTLAPDDTAGLASLLREAVTATGFKGQDVSLILAHPRFGQHHIDAPPAKGTALDAFIRGQVDQQKGFEGPAVWSAQPTFRGKGAQGLLLHLLPKSLLDQLDKGCAKAGLRLVAVVPVMGVIQARLPQLPLGATDLALLAADTGGITSLLIGRPDGQVLLGRSVGGGWSQNTERLLMDLKRTVLFVSQQLGVNIGSLWTLGAPPPEALRTLAGELNLSVAEFPVETGSCYWATEAARWPAGQAPNLISREQQVTPRRRAMFRVSAITAALLAVNAVLIALYFNRLVNEERRNSKDLAHVSYELQGTHKELQRLHAELMRHQASIRELRDHRQPPVAAWFLGHLSEVCPAELLVTGAQIQREDQFWRFRVEGSVLPGANTNRSPAAILTNAVSLFAARLTTGPMHARVTDQSLVTNTPAGGAEPGRTDGAYAKWLRLNPAAATQRRGELAAQPQRFQLEGAIR